MEMAGVAIVKRRAFGIAVASAAATLSLPAVGAQWPVRGRHYIPLRQVTGAPKSDAFEVLEFFEYGSRPCRELEPLLAQWQSGLTFPVRLRRMPVAYWDDFFILQDLYFALETLGLVGGLHRKVFDAIQRERTRLETEEQIGDFMARQGVDRSRFLSALNSDEVASRSLEARQLAERFRIPRTPTFIVGRAWATDVVRAGSAAKAVAVVDVLLRAPR